MIWFLLILFLTIIFYGLFIEPRWFILSRHTVHIDKPLSTPLKILHISDTHFHPRNQFINKLFNKLEKLDDIDLIFVTGDIIDNDNGIPLAAEQLKRLKSRLGIFAIFGNHDHYWYGLRELLGLIFFHIYPTYPNKVDELQKTLEAIGCRVLRNEACEVKIDGTEIYIAGLDDPVTKKDRPEKIAISEKPEQIKILLTHLLDSLQKMKEHKFDIALSGHTHGGQVRIPFFGPIVTHSKLKKKYAAGLNKIDGTQVFTSRGIGTSPTLPSRIFCNPEAVILTIEGKPV